jgi:hypothetical protein
MDGDIPDFVSAGVAVATVYTRDLTPVIFFAR